jgi:hypothetical protein
MNRDDIFRMAREAGFHCLLPDEAIDGRGGVYEGDDNIYVIVERFAALIEQHLSYDSIHTCHDECQRPACVAVREAVKAEREACAEMVAGMDVQHPKYIAAAIRARGEA